MGTVPISYLPEMHGHHLLFSFLTFTSILQTPLAYRGYGHYGGPDTSVPSWLRSPEDEKNSGEIEKPFWLENIKDKYDVPEQDSLDETDMEELTTEKETTFSATMYILDEEIDSLLEQNEVDYSGLTRSLEHLKSPILKSIIKLY